MIFRRREYRIDPERDDWVAPEETLVDMQSEHSTVELPVADGAFRLLHGVVVIACLILIGALWRLAHNRNDELSLISFRNRTVNVTVPPPRGIIMDRNGDPLVTNVPSFDLLVISRRIERQSDGSLKGLDSIARALGRSPEELALEIEDNIRKGAVFFLATDITREQVLSLTGSMPAGFSIITNTKRQYADGLQFSHVIGYVGKVSKKDIALDPYYLPSDTIGRLGIEAEYESLLRGEHGSIVFDASLETSGRAPTPGKNLVLSIDQDVQKQLFNAVYGILKESGLSEGAAIVQNPRDGSVLGMVSFPYYDNNLFSTGKLSTDDYKSLFLSSSRPLFNRVMSGTYNPGSTLKPYVAMVGLQEGIMTPQQIVTNQCVSISIPNPSNPDDPYVFKNWRPDIGAFDLNRAIADSCNVYFFTIAGGNGSFSGMGAEKLTNYYKRGKADDLLGIDLPGEMHGFIPSPEWKYRTQKESWYQGDTYNISIGQGDVTVTPLWINTYIGALANGGTLWQPRVANRVVNEQRMTQSVFEPRSIGVLPFSTSVMKAVKTAMRHTVTEGTGKIFQDIAVPVAAKTGTAEVVKGRRINSLVTLFAPVEDPQIALTVLIEGSASNQGYALRAAHTFLKWYFSTARLGAAPLKPQESPRPSRISLPASASASERLQ